LFAHGFNNTVPPAAMYSISPLTTRPIARPLADWKGHFKPFVFEQTEFVG